MMRFGVWVAALIVVVTVGLILAATVSQPEEVTIAAVVEAVNNGEVSRITYETIGDDRRLKVEYTGVRGYKVVNDISFAKEAFIPYLEGEGADPLRLQVVTLAYESPSFVGNLAARYALAWQFALGASVMAILGIGSFAMYQSILEDAQAEPDAPSE